MITIPKGVACYPLNLEAQRVWHDSRMTPPAGHPAPLVPARMASPQETHDAIRTAEAMRKRARAAGWSCNITYAKGYTLGALHVVESLAVRMRYPSAAGAEPRFGAVACYTRPIGKTYTFDCGFFWPALTFPVLAKSAELDALLRAVGEAPVGEPREAVVWFVDRLAEIRAGISAKSAAASAKRTATKAAKATVAALNEANPSLGRPLAATPYVQETLAA